MGARRGARRALCRRAQRARREERAARHARVLHALRAQFGEGLPIEKRSAKRLPNLMLLGYLLRVLEERLLVGRRIVRRLSREARPQRRRAGTGRPLLAGDRRRGWVFASGQIPLDPRTGALVEGDIEAQTERVLANSRGARGGGLEPRARGEDDRLRDRSRAVRAHQRRVRAPLHGDPPPARATVQVAALPLGAAIEIDAIATIALSARAAPRPSLAHELERQVHGVDRGVGEHGASRSPVAVEQRAEQPRPRPARSRSSGQSARRGTKWASPNTRLAREPAHARLERAAEERLLGEARRAPRAPHTRATERPERRGELARERRAPARARS